MSTTVSAKPAEVRREWLLVDADGKTLGRLASEIARRLKGKHKPIFTPHVDTGDYIVVVNAEKVAVTGNKLKAKMYHRHTGYIGNLKSISLEKQLEKLQRQARTAAKFKEYREQERRIKAELLARLAGDFHECYGTSEIAIASNLDREAAAWGTISREGSVSSRAGSGAKSTAISPVL